MNKNIDSFFHHWELISFPYDDINNMYENTIVGLINYNGNVHILNIEALYPRRGCGTRVMRKLLELSNEYEIVLDLFAKPLYDSDRYINNPHKLVNWYKSFGFIELYYDNDCGYYMKSEWQS